MSEQEEGDWHKFHSTSEFLVDLWSEANVGKGAFGIVKRATHKETGKLYAIKVIEFNSLKEGQLSRIKQEVWVHRQLNSPHIVKLWAAFAEGPRIFMVMDFAAGGSLYLQLLKRKSFSEREAYRILMQVAAALQAMHSKDLFHRDIKPENLLLDSAQNVLLCDFGWAVSGLKTPHRTFCGTYEYMAPEVLYGLPYDCRVDFWSMGVLLFQLLHCCAPYRGKSRQEVVSSLQSSRLDLSKNLSQEVKDLIQKLLETDPDRRLGLKQIKSHPWSAKVTLQIQAQYFLNKPLSPMSRKSMDKFPATKALFNTEQAPDHQKRKKALKRCKTLADGFTDILGVKGKQGKRKREKERNQSPLKQSIKQLKRLLSHRKRM